MHSKGLLVNALDSRVPNAQCNSLYVTPKAYKDFKVTKSCVFIDPDDLSFIIALAQKLASFSELLLDRAPFRDLAPQRIPVKLNIDFKSIQECRTLCVYGFRPLRIASSETRFPYS